MSELRFCTPLGIPHSVFLAWDELDQDKALALKGYERDFCAQCGTRDSDWRDEQKAIIDPPPYEVEAHRCAGCSEIERFRSGQDIGKNSDGLYFRLKPTERER